MNLRLWADKIGHAYTDNAYVIIASFVFINSGFYLHSQGEVKWLEVQKCYLLYEQNYKLFYAKIIYWKWRHRNRICIHFE